MSMRARPHVAQRSQLLISPACFAKRLGQCRLRRHGLQVANSYRFFRSICAGMGEADKDALKMLVSAADVADNPTMTVNDIWASSVLKLFILAEQWPYRTALLSLFAEELRGEGKLQDVPLQSVYMSRPDKLYVGSAEEPSEELSPIHRIDMVRAVPLPLPRPAL